MATLAAPESFKGNFGLWFARFVPWQWNGNELVEWNKEGREDGKSKDSKAKKHYLTTSIRCYKNTHLSEALRSRHQNQEELLKEAHGYYLAMTFNLKLSSRLITGTGLAHAGEVGFLFERNLGLPYLPATGLKGILRLAHALNMAFDAHGEPTNLVRQKGDRLQLDERDPATLIPTLFGIAPEGKDQESQRGDIIVLDAFPLAPPKLATDIINCHHPKYYNGKTQQHPTDDDQPIPVKFLVVEPGTTFVLRLMLGPQAKPYAEEVKKAVFRAMEQLGFGAKTAIGYGHFRLEYPREDNSPAPSKENARPTESALTSKDKMIKIFNGVSKNNKGQSLSKIDDYCNEFLRCPDLDLLDELKRKLDAIGEWDYKNANEKRREVIRVRREQIQTLKGIPKGS